MSSHMPQRIGNRYSNKYMYTHVRNSTIHDSQKVETKYSSIDEWINKFWYTHT